MMGTSHSPACRESPGDCICRTVYRGADGEVIATGPLGTLVPQGDPNICRDHEGAWHFRSMATCEAFAASLAADNDAEGRRMWDLTPVDVHSLLEKGEIVSGARHKITEEFLADARARNGRLRGELTRARFWRAIFACLAVGGWTTVVIEGIKGAL